MKKLFKKGFTLVELLVVIAIIAILGTVSVVGYIGFTEDAKVSNDFTELTEYKTVAEAKLFDGSETVVINDSKCDGEHNKYTLLNAAGNDWNTSYYNYYTKSSNRYSKVAKDTTIPSFTENTYYKKEADTDCTEWVFSYSTSGSSKEISVSANIWDGDGFDTDVKLTADNVESALQELIERATGDEILGDWLVVLDGSNITKVGYRHNASEVSNADGIDAYKVVWDIATSTVEKK